MVERLELKIQIPGIDVDEVQFFHHPNLNSSLPFWLSNSTPATRPFAAYTEQKPVPEFEILDQ